MFLVIVLSPPRPRLRSVPAPLRFASPRNIDGRTERQYHDSTVLGAPRRRPPLWARAKRARALAEGFRGVDDENPHTAAAKSK